MKWRYHMDTDWYGGMGPSEQAVIDELERVNEAYWSHPVIRSYQDKKEAAMEVPCQLAHRYADLSELFHAAKQVAAQAAPNFPLSRIILGQMYPRRLTGAAMDADAATVVLRRIAQDMAY